MEAVATTQAAAPVRRIFRMRPVTLKAELLEYCAEPRDIAEIRDWLGQNAARYVRILAHRGELRNLQPDLPSGLYVDPARVPVLVERISWHAPSAPLDDECQVLVSVQRPGGIDTREGYRSGGVWCCAVTDKPFKGEVIAWAHKPCGPQA